MKLVSYRWDSRIEVGVLDTDSGNITPVAGGDGVATSLTDVISRDVTTRAGLKVAAGAGSRSLSDVTLLAPLRDPARNVMCVGKNYHEHSAEFARSGFDATGSGDQAVPSHPIFFTKPASCIIGPGDEIYPHVHVTEALDYEAEVAVVIGRGGRGINAADAWDHVWGYVLLNDVTARDLQHRHKQWFLGKSLDSFCPMGPWLVTADEIDGANIEIECRVNGELRQRASTADLIFDIPTLISTLSSGMALQPGDILATGTPSGVGIGFNPPRFLTQGDKVTVFSPQLGVLENVVADRAADVPRLTGQVRA